MGFDETLLHCSAPSLCGIKPASLFTMKNSLYGNGSYKINGLNKALEKKGVCILPIQKKDYMLFFVYNRLLLKKLFSAKKSVVFLKEKGYPVGKGFDAILLELCFRLMTYRTFPHEIGFFLGYPLEDVIQFEKTEGKGFIYSGFWKVYGNLDKAIGQMNMYKNCSEECMRLFYEGSSILQVAEKYETKTLSA